MKVLHLTTHLNIGGITSYLYRLSYGLEELGTEVQIASFGGERVLDFQEKGIKIHFLPLNTKSELSPKLILSFLRLKKLYKTEKWDLIHAHTRVTKWLAYFLSSSLNIPYVTTIHGFHTPHLGRKIFPCLGYKTIAISSSVQLFLENHYPKQKNKIITILHGINTNHFNPHCVSNEEKEILKKHLGLKNVPILGNVARLAYEKGHVYLLDIVKYLKDKKNMQVHLIIMGNGKQKNALLQKIHALELKDYVYILPSHKDPRPILSLMDIFVSYHIAPEGFGLSFIEAMAMGKPVVTRYLKGGLSDFIENEKDGFLLKEATIEKTSEKIHELLVSPDLRYKMGEHAMKKVQNSFHYQRMAKETQKIYEAIV